MGGGGGGGGGGVKTKQMLAWLEVLDTVECVCVHRLYNCAQRVTVCVCWGVFVPPHKDRHKRCVAFLTHIQGSVPLFCFSKHTLGATL